jgi:enoyl-CoA hydratase/carnithine racemase
VTAVPERAYSLLRVTVDGAVLRVTLNNPRRKNAIGPVMVNELLYALSDAEADPAVRSVVITGDGDAFCAGGDFAQMTAGSEASGLTPMGDYADLLLKMVNSKKPIVARVNGAAMGGGLGIVAAAHFAVAARGAKLGTPEVNVGLFPMMIMAVLMRVVPRRRLTEMMLFGERVDADEAAAIGLVSRVVEPAELDHAVTAITDKIASKSPLTLSLGLEAMAASDDLALEEALPLLREQLGRCLGTNDAREGLMAFLEKRSPKWTGT